MAREKGNIPVGNIKVAIFPDFSSEVQRRRQSFMEAKCRLQNKHFKYSMLFPARLKIEHDGHALFFEDLEEVISWLDRCATPERAG